MRSEELTNGIIVPVVTPVIFSEILKVIESIVQKGVSKIFLLGTTGESMKLTVSQKKELIRFVAENFPKNAQLLIGITCPSITDSIDLMNLSYEVGAVASVIAPAVIGPNCKTTIETLLTKGKGDLLFYNYPGIAEGRSILIDHIVPFMNEDRVLGIKDSSGDLAYFDEILKRRKGANFKVFYGPENNLKEILQKDIDGFVPGTGNIAPEQANQIWLKKDQGPWLEWTKIKDEMKRKDEGNYIKALKLILKERGIISSAELITSASY